MLCINKRLYRSYGTYWSKRVSRCDWSYGTKRMPGSSRPCRSYGPAGRAWYARRYGACRRSRPRRSDRLNRPNRPRRSDRLNRPRRSDRPNRPRRSDRPNRSSRSNRPNRSSRSNRPRRSRWRSRSNRSSRSNRPNRSSRSDRPNRSCRSRRPDWSNRPSANSGSGSGRCYWYRGCCDTAKYTSGKSSRCRNSAIIVWRRGKTYFESFVLLHM